MQAITADTVIACITHDDRPSIQRQAGTERSGLTLNLSVCFCVLYARPQFSADLEYTFGVLVPPGWVYRCTADQCCERRERERPARARVRVVCTALQAVGVSLSLTPHSDCSARSECSISNFENFGDCKLRQTTPFTDQDQMRHAGVDPRSTFTRQISSPSVYFVSLWLSDENLPIFTL